MRCRLLVLLVLLGLLTLAVPTAHAAIAVVQAVSCSVQATSCTTAAITSTTGNLFVVSAGYCCASGGLVSITDSKSNSYGNAIAEFLKDLSFARQLYVASGTGGGSHTFTANNSSSSIYVSFTAIEVSGAAASPLDKTVTGTETSSTSHTSTATTTTAQANELLIGFGTTQDTASFTTDTGAGWTERGNYTTAGSNEGFICGSKGVTATGTYAYTWTSSVATRAASGISTWKEAAAVGVRQRCIGCGADGKVIE